MRVASVEAITTELERAGVRYLVAGGLAVTAHGYLRLTNDVDLVISLDPANVQGAFRALASLGYRPAVPVRADEFADRVIREAWIRDKGMHVLQFWSDKHRETPVDVFVTEPFPFDEEYTAAYTGELAPGVIARFVRLKTLIRMKEAAARPRDLDDVQHLRWILEDQGDERA